MSVNIRRADNADVEGVVRVIKAVYDEYGFTWDEADYHADLYDIEAHYDAQGHGFFVGEAHGQIVGTVALETFERIPGAEGSVVEHEDVQRVGGCDCSLERLYVHPEARRQGVGRTLLLHVMEMAKAGGKSAMEMWSDKRFTDAHRLYQTLGAEVVGERICHDPDQSPEWGLIIRL